MVQYKEGVHKESASSVTGIGGLNYQGPYGLDKNYYGTGNAASIQYGRAAQQILQGAEGADAALLRSYRDLYRSRLGGAAAAQRQSQDLLGAEAAGQGLSPDIVRRLLASGQAQQAQQLESTEGEIMGAYGADRARLIQGSGNALANLTVDELKFGKTYAAGRRGASSSALQGVASAAATIIGSYFGGPLGGFAANQAVGAAGKSFSGGGTVAPSGYNASQYGAFGYDGK